jgi:hypothetical protein
MFVVSVVCCQVEVSAKDWSLVQRSPTECGASLCVIKKPRQEEAKARYWAVKIQPQWVVTPGKQTQCIYMFRTILIVSRDFIALRILTLLVFVVVTAR